jgi:hypothetical protein
VAVAWKVTQLTLAAVQAAVVQKRRTVVLARLGKVSLVELVVAVLVVVRVVVVLVRLVWHRWAVSTEVLVAQAFRRLLTMLQLLVAVAAVAVVIAPAQVAQVAQVAVVLVLVVQTLKRTEPLEQWTRAVAVVELVVRYLVLVAQVSSLFVIKELRHLLLSVQV